MEEAKSPNFPSFLNWIARKRFSDLFQWRTMKCPNFCAFCKNIPEINEIINIYFLTFHENMKKKLLIWILSSTPTWEALQSIPKIVTLNSCLEQILEFSKFFKIQYFGPEISPLNFPIFRVELWNKLRRIFRFSKFFYRIFPIYENYLSNNCVNFSYFQ